MRQSDRRQRTGDEVFISEALDVKGRVVRDEADRAVRLEQLAAAHPFTLARATEAHLETAPHFICENATVSPKKGQK